MISEDGLIARHLAPIAGPGSLGLLDDAALLAPPPGHELVLTKDMLAAGIHFFPDDPAGSIARKALRVNLSDLAAKGAEPLGFLLGLALPAGTEERWMADFAAALGEDARAYRCPLLGGDTVRAAGGLTVSVTAIGSCPAGAMVPRTGGRVGQRLVVTGTIGDAALGLRLRQDKAARWAEVLNDEERGWLADRYLHPKPRNRLALAIREHAAAAMDVSDGLLGDAVKLGAAASHGACAPWIDLARVPLSGAARAALMAEPALIEPIVAGGDDYEVLMALEPEKVEDLLAACAALGCPAAEIGELTDSAAPAFTGLDGRPASFGALRFEHGWS
ncbi:MAG: thiamine-phosphate kinase [Bosea sp.]|nr:thiamine-phosphate kinase [Bosea sp. (in: a-proteobacteria)]